MWQEFASRIGAAIIMEQIPPHTPAAMRRADIIADRVGAVIGGPGITPAVSGFNFRASIIKHPIGPDLQTACEFRFETPRLSLSCRHLPLLLQVMQWAIIPKSKRILCPRFGLFEILDLDIGFNAPNPDLSDKQFACLPVNPHRKPGEAHTQPGCAAPSRTHKIL